MIHWHLPNTSSGANVIGHLTAKKGFVEKERYGYEIYLPPREPTLRPIPSILY
jgi:hypothetical protein